MEVGVIGSGAIGPDLAYGFMSALGGKGKVYLVDIRQDALDAGVARIKGYIAKGVARGKLSARAAGAIEASLVPTLELADLAGCDYVLEAASEDLKVKKAIIGQLEDVVSADCLIGFATSGLPRAWIAADAKHPERCFVNHPFFPAWRSLPIEVVAQDDDSALAARMNATLKRLGKVPIRTADVVTFAADDVFCNYCAEAARIVAEGVANPAQVDAIVNGAIGGGGPLNVLDGTRGNLLVKHCQELMRDDRPNGEWFDPPAILAEKGNGLWHDRKNPHDPAHDEALAETVLDRILAVLLARTLWVIENDVCAPTEMNWMTRTALGFSTGLVDLAHEMGADRVYAVVMKYAAAHPGFEVPRCITERTLPALFGNVTMQRDGDIEVITVFRPEVKNALNARTLGEIDAAMQAAEADPEVRGVVFTGFGGALAGADINELARIDKAADAVSFCMREHAIAQRIEAMKTPVVAALDGPVLGGGAELSMTCHARVVGSGTFVGQPEVNLGIIPGYGGSMRLPRLVGFELAFEMVRGGAPIMAKQAVESGWAAALADDPVEAAKALIRDHHAGKAEITPVDPAPMAVPDTLPKVDIGHRSLTIDAIVVDVMRRGLQVSLAEGLAIEAEGFGRCIDTVDMHIGMTNFIQNGPRVPAAFLHE